MCTLIYYRITTVSCAPDTTHVYDDANGGLYDTIRSYGTKSDKENSAHVEYDVLY